MKTYTQALKLVLQLEKDSKDNKFRIKLKAWKFSNGTEVLVRIYQHDSSSVKATFDGNRTLGEGYDLILAFLAERNIIIDPNNWKYHNATELQKQDEFEDAKDCMYFSWRVKENLLLF